MNNSRLTLFMLANCALVSTGALADLPQTTPKAIWVHLDYSTRNANVQFKPGDVCLIPERSHLNAYPSGKEQASTHIQVHLLGGPGIVPAGSECPIGVRFKLAFGEYKTFTKIANAQFNAKAKSEELDLTTKYLVHRGHKIVAGGLGSLASYPVYDWTWVNVVKNISNDNSDFQKDEACGIDKGGNLRVIAFAKDHKRALIEYSTRASAAGSQCPSGTRFFTDIDSLFAKASAESPTEYSHSSGDGW